MNSKSRTLVSATVGLSLFLASALNTSLLRSVGAQQNAPQPTSLKVANKNIGGAIELTFDTLLYGDIKVYLPDDMAAGDTISGTVVAEPKGNTPEERAQNQDKLEGFVVEVGDEKASASKSQFTWLVPVQQPATPPRYMVRITEVLPNKEVARTAIPILTQPLNVPRPNVITASDFKLPTLGQPGRAVEVFGPFDGNSSNTTINWPRVESQVQDFEKSTEDVSGGFGLIRPLAESPRKAVVRSPNNVTGPVELNLKEGAIEAKGPFRNVGVRLSAGKTNLLKGERTTVTVEVSGLEGIKTAVPLQLDARGVITMDGGNFQNLLIPPSGIQSGGVFVTTRAITGQQAGGFSVVATVIVRPYDVCLRDDRNGILWNTFTGNYIFANMVVAGQPVNPVGLVGSGKPVMKGCILTLTHNAPDRRVFARLDVCTNSGDATIQTKSPKSETKITDTNTSDNTCTANK